ncbi:hypothetical protein PVAND_017109 [Polypedilum vanderplanki]|uniref:Uncharacterized protein n=1 Tax=Polypedilum vanderplanki TaxID=319348 RepID=A0A9J6BH58_POLVA|nr:hypothetical protein PVAND_017109 [Polypedilum vanderplanki]
MQKPTFNKITKVWSGPKVPPIYNPDQNLGQLILKVLEQTPETVTQISADTKVSVTCGQMRERTEKFAKYLNSLGLKQGDVVGIIAANTENLAPAVFTCFLLGLPVNPLAPIMTQSDIVQMFRKTKPKLILCDGNNLKIVQNAVNMMKSDAKIITVMEDVENYDSVTKILNRKAEKNFDYPEIDSNSTALILCSSGSTGFPKGIPKTHKEIIIQFISASPYNLNKNILFQTSFIFWFSGIYFVIYGALYKCLRIITAQKLTPDVIIKIIHEYKVTHVFTGPYIYINLLQNKSLKPFESIKHWRLGGQNVPKELCEKFQNFVPNGIISNVYGSTECNFHTCDVYGEKFGSTGKVLENTEIKIIDENGNSLDSNQQGEICIKKCVPFLGYLDEPEQTKEAYDGEWFKTGDIGYFDDEGFFYIIDRKKEILIYQGFLTTPSELETIINKIDGVMSSCVVGVHQESIASDIIHAFVIVDESKNLTEFQIENFVNSKVIDEKKLRGGVHFIKDFPLTASGKVSRKELKNLAKNSYTKNREIQKILEKLIANDITSRTV